MEVTFGFPEVLECELSSSEQSSESISLAVVVLVDWRTWFARATCTRLGTAWRAIGSWSVIPAKKTRQTSRTSVGEERDGYPHRDASAARFAQFRRG